MMSMDLDAINGLGKFLDSFDIIDSSFRYYKEPSMLSVRPIDTLDPMRRYHH